MRELPLDPPLKSDLSRSKYAEEAKQQFKMTLVEDNEHEAEAATPSSAAVQDV